jgi:hypothetical protein
MFLPSNGHLSAMGYFPVVRGGIGGSMVVFLEPLLLHATVAMRTTGEKGGLS